MPACAVARRTPAISGMSGTSLGARGDTAEDIEACHRRACPGDPDWLATCLQNGNGRDKSRPSRIVSIYGSILFLCRIGRLGWRCRTGWRGRFGIGLRLVLLLDLRLGAQLGDQVRLGFAGDELLELRLHVGKGRRLLLALVLELDDVPAELGMHRFG